MLIREMSFEDIAQVVEIENDCFSLPWSEKSFIDSIVREDTLFLVCTESSSVVEHKGLKEDAAVERESWDQREHVTQIAGYIGMYISYGEGNITNVAVSQECRKRGYGEALVLASKEKAKEKQVEKIFLEVRVSNTPAISLYEKMGFEKIGMRKNFYDYPKEDAYIMCCDLMNY